MPISLRIPRPRRIDLYIISEIIGPFGGGLLFFAFVFLMFQVLRLAEFMIEHGIPLPVLGKIVGLFLVSFLPLIIPMSFLVAVLVGFGRLSSDSEIVALKAGGIGLPRISAPVVAVALAVGAVTVPLGMNWVPSSEREIRTTLLKISNTQVVSSIREGTFTSGFFDLLFFAEEVDHETGKLGRVFIFDEREPKSPFAVVAKEGEIVPVRTESELSTSMLLRLKDGSIHQADVSGESYHRINFDEDRIFLNITEGGGGGATKPKTLTYDEIRARMAKAGPDEQIQREGPTEIWRRIAISISPLIFAFLGIGLGTVPTRSVKAGAALVTLIVILVYWGLQSFMTAYAYSDRLPPLLAMQIPNFALLIPAIWAFRRSSW